MHVYNFFFLKIKLIIKTWNADMRLHLKEKEKLQKAGGEPKFVFNM